MTTFRIILCLENKRRTFDVVPEILFNREKFTQSNFLISKEYTANNQKELTQKILSGDEYTLESGENFSLDCHGIWMLKRESRELFEKENPDEVNWWNGIQPDFPTI